MDQLIGLLTFLVLMILGYLFGSAAEKRHYQSIRQREDQFRHVVVLNKRFPPEELSANSHLVTGGVVVSVDYFKRFLAALRILVGGRLNSYESLLDRARREAILRMQEKAHAAGASIVYNVRFETSSISKGQNDRIGSIEVLAYGTALI